MNILKYRIWSKVENRYYGNDELDTIQVANNGRIYELDIDATYYGDEYICKDDITDQCIVEVYLFKDRGGKEVYEGDIVHFRCPKCGKEVMSDIAYLENQHKFKHRTDSDCIGHLYTIDDKEVELIGNIHEHPDLLIKYLESLDMPEEKKLVQKEKLRKLLNPEHKNNEEKK